MAELSDKAKSLASEIRAMQSGSERYDLAGYDSDLASQLMRAAFEQPIECDGMLRVTFVVGGGQKVRQKYPDHLGWDICKSLESIQYAEDRGAGMVLESQGSFKHQHDTDKDLKFVHVYPFVKVKAQEGNQQGEEDGGGKELSPSEQCIFASTDKLKKLMKRNVTSVSQKRSLLRALKNASETVNKAEKKLTDMEDLNEEEQDMYDNARDLEEKVKMVSNDIDSMIDSGRVASNERKELISLFEGKAREMEQQAGEAEKEGKEKRAGRLRESAETARGRKRAVEESKPEERRLKNEDELVDLTKRLREIEVADKSKQLKDVKTVQRLGSREDVEQRIHLLKDDELGWFDDPKRVDERLKAALNSSSQSKKK